MNDDSYVLLFKDVNEEEKMTTDERRRQSVIFVHREKDLTEKEGDRHFGLSNYHSITSSCKQKNENSPMCNFK